MTILSIVNKKVGFCRKKTFVRVITANIKF